MADRLMADRPPMVNTMIYARSIYGRSPADLWQIARRKKMNFFSFPPLRIKTAFARLAAFPRKGCIIRSLIVPSRKEKRLDALIAR